jgi:hypothetical protein
MAVVTVASRPKILQNNSKPAPEKNCWPRKNGGRTAAVFDQKRPKTDRKKYLMNKHVFCLANLSFCEKIFWQVSP